MSVKLSIENVPDEWVAALRRRAEGNRSSLEAELLAAVERALAEPGGGARQGSLHTANRPPPGRRLSLADLDACARNSGLRMPSEAASILRRGRDGSRRR